MPRDLPIAPPPGEDDLGSDFLVDGLEDWGVVGRPEEEQTNLLADLDIEAMRAEVEVRDWPLSLREICEKEREEHKKNYARHANDSGSPEVQVALFSARIKHVTQHVIDNPKDFASRRGLLALVSKRRRLLNYYFKKKPQAAEQLVKDLGIRFRFRAKIPSRDEKYREFTIRANRKKK
ncbi:hypothetical protein CTAYLR_003234 [Chrysophaeum taylorii]|uniref:30S ribosomal protein S15 n=1 Tax=Chrysophaeum taylorii TaxID=2483200 RepID=A0AAD7UAB8_9STRA|nr:hypothetical protein CTAYLR_003234 [Chrysophaeum taylorii]